jgi:hypothetical protein
MKQFNERAERYRQEKMARETAVKELEEINEIKQEVKTNE